MTDDLKDLLGLLQETRVEDGRGQLDVAEVTGAFGHALSACLALKLPVDRAKARIVEALLSWLRSGLVHGLGVLNVRHTHVLDLLGRHDTKLYLLDRLEGRTRVREIQVCHLA